MNKSEKSDFYGENLRKYRWDMMLVCAIKDFKVLKVLDDFTPLCGKQKRVSDLYRTATTAYPCSIPRLGEFCGSWSYKTYPTAKV